jgi:tripartite-type tricarboxylate transporter receptor subunit TctC
MHGVTVSGLSCGLLKRFAIAAALTASPVVAQAADRPFYAGKTINVIVGEPAGGAADAYARLLSRHLARHMPGTPAIVVQNMPGAGTLKAVMYVNTTAPADGTVLATFSSALIEQTLIARQRVNVDFRNYSWIGNLSEDVRVCYVWAATGVKNYSEMRSRTRPLFWGATAPGTAGNADSQMLQNLFGIKIQQVQGYAGAADKRLAVERREIDGDCAGWIALPEDWIKTKKINVMLRLSPTLAAGMDANVPFGGDLTKDANEHRLYDFLIAPERLGRLYMTSPKVPAQRLAILRAAFDKMVADPVFRSEADRMHLLVTPMGGDEVASRIKALYATPPDIIARAKAIVGE